MVALPSEIEIDIGSADYSWRNLSLFKCIFYFSLPSDPKSPEMAGSKFCLLRTRTEIVSGNHQVIDKMPSNEDSVLLLSYDLQTMNAPSLGEH